jgi:hypothetical protein
MPFNPEVSRRRKKPPVELNGPPDSSLQPTIVTKNYRAKAQTGSDLESEQAKACLTQCETWWQEQVDYHATNRREQLIDFDFYDHDQWDEESIQILAERNQAALTFNLIKPVVDWAVGTERRTRVDWGVYPRRGDSVEIAEVKENLLKFVSDTSLIGYERSRQFKDSVIGGVGWLREFVQTDKRDGPPVAARHVNWKSVRWDPFSTSNTLEDCRATSIERYIDLDYAIAMFPDRVDSLKGASSKTIDPGIELLADDSLMPQVFWGQRASLLTQFGLTGTASVGRRARPRVRLIEMEYRRPVVERRVIDLIGDYSQIDGQLYDEKDGSQADLLNTKKIALDDQIASQIWVAIFSPGFLCLHQPLPYKHNKFSLTPMWCYRRHRDGMPYGLVRGLRDPQDEYNKRRSKLLFQLSTNRVIYEAGAIDEADEDTVLAEVAKPNAQIRLADGALVGGKFKIENNVDVAEEQFKLLNQARQDIHEGSSITPENQGLQTEALSGKAILAKQQQGAVGTAEIFDNYRLSIQVSGTKTLSLCEQYLTRPMQIRINGEKKPEFIAINQPSIDPNTGDVVWQNDVTSDQCDFVVDEQDYRETVRQAQAQTLMETVSRLDPNVALKMLDLVFEMSDIPNREEFVKRIRMINGADQFDDDADADPDKKAEQQAAAQKQNDAASAEADLQRRERESVIAKNNASADKLSADAAQTQLTTKSTAIDTAHKVALSPAIAPVADRLANPRRAGMNALGPGNFEPAQPSSANAIPQLTTPLPTQPQ